MTNKMTKREVLNAMLNDSNFSANADFVAFAKHELELLDKKKESKTPTKVQVKNELLKTEILNLMAEGIYYTCTQIVKLLDSEDVLSTQKGTALLKGLADEGKVEIIRDKKSTFYKRVA